MLTKKKFLSLLDALVPELTDENEELLTAIKTDFDERDGYLRAGGTVIDDEDVDEFEYVVNEPADFDNTEELEKLKTDLEEMTGKYDALRTKYRERFFYGTPEDSTTIEPVEDEDVEEPETIDDLLKKEEE